MLGPHGLEQYTIAVYRMMVAHPGWSVQEIARTLGSTPSDVARSIEKLADAALVRLGEGDARHGSAVNPEVGLANALERHKEELNFWIQEFLKDRSLADSLANRSDLRQADDDSKIDLIEGTGSVRETLDRLLRRAQSQVLCLVADERQGLDTLPEDRTFRQVADKDQVRVRAIVLSDVHRHGPGTDWARRIAENGAEVRLSAYSRMQLLLVDRTVAVLPVTAVSGRPRAMLVTSPEIVAALDSLAEQVWDGSAPLAGRSRRAEQDFSSREEELLRLLGRGMTDEAVARKMGISLRTVRRLMSDVMRRINATSRFEAGLRLAGLGLDDSDTPALPRVAGPKEA
jgi:DNA-binding NarL/FixJ family response regulator